MTQLFGNGPPFESSFLSSNAADKQASKYFVREPLGKRHADESDMLDGAPRAKRRFEKVSARLEQIRISNDADSPPVVNADSSDEDMMDEDATSSQTADVIIEEPEEHPKRIRLDEKLQQYLDMAKKHRRDLLPSLHVIRGDELTLWRPPGVENPFDDPSMRGRIQEVESDDDIVESVEDSFIAFPDENIPDEEMSTASSVESVPRIVELSNSAASSPLSVDQLDDEMDFE